MHIQDLQRGEQPDQVEVVVVLGVPHGRRTSNSPVRRQAFQAHTSRRMFAAACGSRSRSEAAAVVNGARLERTASRTAPYLRLASPPPIRMKDGPPFGSERHA